MSNSPPDVPPPPQPQASQSVEYAPPPPRVSMFRQVGRFIQGTLLGFIVIFIPTFFAGGAAFEDSPLPWWAWPSVLVAAAVCVALALMTRRRRPATAAGVWVGTALGLLLAGACFTGM
jgi:hypothetical protein